MKIDNLHNKSFKVGNHIIYFKVIYDLVNKDEYLNDECYACFCYWDNTIRISMKYCSQVSVNTFKEILRHEILHAYFYHSKVHPNKVPIDNEETIVEWIAQKFPTISKTFNEVYDLLK
ncbi:MAG: hypothetical protein HUJ68_07525 [Clostridia bacterium]|nr:hypothetical protein [Clostridia bacterium]